MCLDAIRRQRGGLCLYRGKVVDSGQRGRHAVHVNVTPTHAHMYTNDRIGHTELNIVKMD